jgi:hypothetical protein
VNGQPGGIVYLPGETVVSTVTLEIAGDRIVAIDVVANPDKLQHVRTPA